MADWMEYLYMQKPIPANATGVNVKLTAIDPNNNNIDIATVSSDMSGYYYYKWTPELEGSYKIVASFEGSNSYWPSYAETAVGIDASPSAQPTTTPTPTQTPAISPTPITTPSPAIVNPESSTNAMIYIAVAAVVVIAVIAAIAVFLRKRK